MRKTTKATFGPKKKRKKRGAAVRSHPERTLVLEIHLSLAEMQTVMGCAKSPDESPESFARLALVSAVHNVNVFHRDAENMLDEESALVPRLRVLKGT